MKEKTYVEDIDRSIYDVKDEERDAYKVDEGLTEAIVEQISREKKDPPWMELFRLQALQIYNEMPVPDWGPSIEGLGYEPYRDVCAAEYKDDGKVVGCAAGHQGHL